MWEKTSLSCSFTIEPIWAQIAGESTIVDKLRISVESQKAAILVKKNTVKTDLMLPSLFTNQTRISRKLKSLVVV